MALLDAIPLIRGDSYEWAFEFVDEVEPEQFVPRDVSGMTLAFTVKRSPSDSDADALTQAHAVLPNDANSQAGLAWLFVPSTETDHLTVLDLNDKRERVYYDFQLSYRDGLGRLRVETFDVGYKRVVPDATRTTFL